MTKIDSRFEKLKNIRKGVKKKNIGSALSYDNNLVS